MDAIREFYNRRNKRLEERGVQVRYDYDRPSEDYDWITINGVHTPIDDAGNISGGAGGKFNGKKYTGSKMQRSKKRTAKVGAGAKKVSLKDIKGKALQKRLKSYMDEHDGQMPDKDGLHDLSYYAYGHAAIELQKKVDKFRQKYRGASNYNLALRLEETEESRDRLAQMAKTADAEDNKFIKERLAEYDKKIDEIKKDPKFTRHEKDWKSLNKAIDAVFDAKQDTKALMYNKGENFGSSLEAQAYLETTGWFPEVSRTDMWQWDHTSNLDIATMSPKFAGGFATAVDTFRTAFPKLSEDRYVLQSLKMGYLDYGSMGGYSPADNGIIFSESYYTPSKIKYGESNYTKDVKSGFHPQGTTLVATAYHEITHAMEYCMKEHDRTGKQALKGRAPSMIIFERVQDRLGDHSYNFKSKVSRYAERSYAGEPDTVDIEFLAEAMAEAYNSKTPRPIAVAVREEWEKLYHEVYD